MRDEIAKAPPRRLQRMVSRIYGPTVVLVRVKNLKRGMILVRSRIGSVADNSDLLVADLLAIYPPAEGNYFLRYASGVGENVKGEKWAIVSPGGMK